MHHAVHRRQFLGCTAATSLALLASRQVPAFAAPAAGMRFGLVTYLWGKDMDLPTVIDACTQSGVLGVELRTEHKHGVEPSLDKQQRAEVRKRFADSPVTLVGYGSNAEYHANDPAKLRANVELTKQYIQLMHDCGGSGVKVKPNSFVEQIGKALNEVGQFGQDHGQKIRVEVHGSGTSELPVMKAIFDVADHPNVYVCWNSNDEDLKGDGLEANFRLVQSRMGDTVHVRELNEGNYPYAKLMQLFQGIQYQGWILLEARTNPQDKVAAMTEQRHVFEAMLR